MPSDRESNHQRPDLMVTGASGNLGHWICRMALKAWQVSGIHFRHPVGVKGVRAVQLDLTCRPEVEKLFDVLKPRAVIHAAAISQPALCERNPQATKTVNVGVPEYLACLCADRGIPFVFTSTDLVFDGLASPYCEEDGVTPICAYGRQKARAEEVALDRYSDALVCRMPLMIGVGPRKSSSFCMQMLSDIRHGRRLRLLTDEYRTPVDYQSAALGLLNLLGSARGRLHLGGRSRVSRFDLGLLMARQLAVDPTMIEPVTIDNLSLAVARSPDCSLISDEAYALGYDPIPLPDAVRNVVDQFKVISKG